MVRFICFLVITLFALSLEAQTLNTDSLRRRLNDLPEGKEKIKNLYDLAAMLKGTDQKQAFQAVEEGFQMAQRIGDKYSIIRGYWMQCELHLQEYHYAEAHEACDYSLQMALESNDSTWIVESLFRRADCYERASKLPEYVAVCTQALAMGERIEFGSKKLAGRYSQLGGLVWSLGDFEAALNYSRRGLEMYQSAGFPQGECYALTQLSNIYGGMGDKVKALEMQQKAYDIARKTGDNYWSVVSLNNICDLQMRLGNFDQALKLASELSQVNHLLKDPQGDVEYYRLMGRIFYAMKDPEQAQVNLEKALDLSKKLKNYYILAGVWVDLTPLMIDQHKTQRAEHELRELIVNLQSNKDSFNLAQCRMLLGDVKVAQGDFVESNALYEQAAAWYKDKKMAKESGDLAAKMAELQLRAEKPAQALAFAQLSLQYLAKTHSKTAIADAHELLYRVYKQLGDFPNALLHHEKHFLYLDSIKTQDLYRRLAEERVKQNVEDIEAEKNRAERESALLATQNNLYLALGAALLLILIVGAYLFWQLRKAKNLLDAQNLQLAQLNQTKDKFFGIIAHDLRGPLAAFRTVGIQLKSSLDKNDLQSMNEISDLLSQSAAGLSALLDNLLSWALLNRGMIPYNPEPVRLQGAVQDIFRIYEYAAKVKGIRLESNVPENQLVQADLNALQAILRNLIGNAIKFTPAHQDGCVSVGCEERNGMVFININDNGTGISAEQIDKLFTLEKRSEWGTSGEKGAGLGLVLCKELIEMHKGMLRVFSNQGKGSTFEFSLQGFQEEN